MQGRKSCGQEAYHYRIQVVNEAVAEKVIDTLSLSGIPVQNTEELEKQQGTERKIIEKIWQWILGLAGSLFLSGVVLIRQQGKTVDVRTQAFTSYMQQISRGRGKESGKIGRCSILLQEEWQIGYLLFIV